MGPGPGQERPGRLAGGGGRVRPGFVYESARGRWRLAEALAGTGQREEAEHEWKLATDAAERLAAVPLLTALADVARRARLGLRPASYPPGVLAGLTAREREVLELLSEGMSNREIADKLFIAPKTASVHVSNILAKLGASSRTEAAAIAYRQGPAVEEPAPAPPPLRG